MYADSVEIRRDAAGGNMEIPISIAESTPAAENRKVQKSKI